MRFSHKILLIPLIGAIGFLVVLASFLSGANQNMELMRQVEREFFVALEVSHQLEKVAVHTRHTFVDAVTSGDDFFQDELDEHFHDFTALVQRARNNPSMDQRLLNRVENAYNDYVTVARPVTLNMIGSELNEELYQSVEKMNLRYSQLTTILAEAIEEQRAMMEAAMQKTRERSLRSIRTVKISIFASVVVMLLFSLVTIDRILRPLRSLTAATRAIAEGNLDHTIDYRARDEMGTLAEDFRSMQRSLIAYMKQQREAERALRESAHSAGMAEIATSVLHNVGNALNGAKTANSMISRTLKQSKVPDVIRLARLLNKHRDDMEQFIRETPQGQQLPRFMEQLAGVLDREYTSLRAEQKTLEKSHEHIQQIIALQQEYAGARALLEEVDLRDVVRDAMQLFDASFERHHVKLEIVPMSEDLHAVIDKHRVLQILINLLKNARDAVKHTEGERLIRVNIAVSGDGISIQVADNGAGIPEEHLQRIFQYGFTTKKDGHGYGLHGCAIAAKEMGGSLEVTSEGDGHGASFTLVLPPEQAADGEEG